MQNKDILKTIRQIQIQSNQIVNELLAGEYKSVFQGIGMEFDEVRKFQSGDEVRSIDWNVTARMGHPYVKRYIEDRQRNLFLLVDMSASGSFGTGDMSKNEIAARIAALLAFSAIKNHDKVGLLIFSDRTELFIPPKMSRSHVLRIIREVICFQPAGRQTDIAHALSFFGRIAHKRSIVFLISDFQDSGYEHPATLVAERHDLIGVSVNDPREEHFPNLGLVDLEDAETGERVTLDARKENPEQALLAQRAQLREKFQKLHLDLIETSTGREPADDIIRFFKKRARRQTSAATH